MAEHPLVRDDEHLIQDYILTKAALLLARDATASEFRFELDAIRELSAHQWSVRNVFLLDYTLARYVVALEAVGEQPAPDTSEFVRSFTAAVREGRHEDARTLRLSARKPPEESATGQLASTLALFERLLRLKKDRTISSASEFLPGPYPG